VSVYITDIHANCMPTCSLEFGKVTVL